MPTLHSSQHLRAPITAPPLSHTHSHIHSMLLWFLPPKETALLVQFPYSLNVTVILQLGPLTSGQKRHPAGLVMHEYFWFQTQLNVSVVKVRVLMFGLSCPVVLFSY